MQTWTAELLYESDLILGEGAHWHSQWKKFLYIDIDGGKVGRIDTVTKITEEIAINEKVGTVVPANDNKLIVALKSTIEEIDFETGQRRILESIESDIQDNRCNDGKCDAAGRLWIGTTNMPGGLNQAALYCFDGSLQMKLDNVSVSNGICWSKDNTIMYYIDSFAYNIKAFDFEISTGTISNERVLIKINEPGYIPDGMTIDDEGMLWVAIWGGACVNRYDPGSGKLIGKIKVAAPNVTACAFGGDDMKTMFITTARAGLEEDQLQRFPLSGSLFYITINIKGAEMNDFSLK
ncbi:SMP-30/gluconolactonase/LRE family protein [Mucilaginibacter sp.]|uniref:SMP-30/gluconolactonase/LRE family protein n=1 Tax=Mucilaginibacter sp. TaxID=1882438 RepID=UPI0025F3E066|nr:SMP-30/gluconolactonase/LRE family protein [Mucilaginibacter sp.]